MRAQDPDGNRWTVRRRWAPWPHYFQAPLDRINRPFGNEVHDHWGGVSATLGRASAVPLIGSLLTWIGLIILWPFAVLTRVVLRRPWPVEVRREGELWRTEEASTFAAAGPIIERLVDDLNYGRIPERTTPTRPRAWHTDRPDHDHG